MIKIANTDVKLKFEYHNILSGRINEVKTPLFMFWPGGGKYFINVHVDEKRRIQLNLNNQKHFVLSTVELQKLAFIVNYQKTGGLVVVVNGNELHRQKMGSWSSMVVLVGRAMFGKTSKSFSQFFTQSCVNQIRNIKFSDKPTPEKFESQHHESPQFLKPFVEYEFFHDSSETNFCAAFDELKSSENHQTYRYRLSTLSNDRLSSLNLDEIHLLVFEESCSFLKDLVDNRAEKINQKWQNRLSKQTEFADFEIKGNTVDVGKAFDHYHSIQPSLCLAFADLLFKRIENAGDYGDPQLDSSFYYILGKIAGCGATKSTLDFVKIYFCKISLLRRNYFQFFNAFYSLEGLNKKTLQRVKITEQYFLLYTIYYQNFSGERMLSMLEACFSEAASLLDSSAKVDALGVMQMACLAEQHHRWAHHSHAGFFRYPILANVIAKAPDVKSSKKCKSDSFNYCMGLINLFAARPSNASRWLERSKLNAHTTGLLSNCYLTAGEVWNAEEIYRKCSELNVPRPEWKEANFHIAEKIRNDFDVQKEKYFPYPAYGETLDKELPVVKSVRNKCNIRETNHFIADHDFELEMKIRVDDLAGLKRVKILSHTQGFEIYVCEKNVEVKFSNSDFNGEAQLDLRPMLTISCGPIGLGENSITLARKNGILQLDVNNNRVEKSISHDYLIFGGSTVFESSPDLMCLTHFRFAVFGYKAGGPKKSIEIYTSWYGEDFTNILFGSLLPSLKREDGLPSLKKDYRIVWRLYTSKEQVKSLQKRLHFLREVCDEVIVDAEILGYEGFEPRDYLHLTYLDCLEKALESNSMILFAPPDHIFGEGLENLITNTVDGEYAVCGHPRISFEKVWSAGNVEKVIFSDKSNKVYRSNTELTIQAFEKYPHMVVKNGIKPLSIKSAPEENSTWWRATKKHDHYAVHFKEPPPVLFCPKRDLIVAMLSEAQMPPFERVDHEIVDWCFKTGRLKVIDDNREFCWLEYCRDTRNYPTIINNYWPKSATEVFKHKLKWYFR